jgi:hypothetical protein
MTTRYGLPLSVRLSEFDSSLPGSGVLAVIGARHYEVRGVSRALLECLATEPHTLGELAALLAARGYPQILEETLLQIITALMDKGLVAIVGRPITQRAEDGTASSGWKRLFVGYFAFRLPLISSERLKPFSSQCAKLLHPYAILLGCPAMLAFQVYLLTAGLARDAYGALHQMSSHMVLLSLVLSYCSLLLHELGHAAACIRCGVDHGPMGFSIYLIFPGFYTDVSAAWRLPAAQRLVIDSAGIFVTLACATACGVLGLVLHHAIFSVMAFLCLLTAFANLNPFVRMDGYWMLSDVLGVANMMTANREVIAWVLKRMIGRTAPQPRVLTLGGLRRYIYVAYVLAFTAFMAYFLYAFYGWYLPRAIRVYPRLVESLLQAWSRAGFSDLGLAALRLAIGTVPIVVPTMYLVRWLSKARGSVQWATPHWKRLVSLWR